MFCQVLKNGGGVVPPQVAECVNDNIKHATPITIKSIAHPSYFFIYYLQIFLTGKKYNTLLTQILFTNCFKDLEK